MDYGAINFSIMILKNLLNIRKYSKKIESTCFFVSTPIYYVNASPHIGHLYSSVIADTINRFNKLKWGNNSESIFITGTDEHGLKICQAAEKNKVDTIDYCNRISDEYRDLAKQFNVAHTDFIRTTEERHIKAVQHFWTELISRDHIYLSTYSGWYCVPDETFLTENQLKFSNDGRRVSIESGHAVEWNDETNYCFKLSEFRDDVIYWLKQGNRIKPKVFEKILFDALSEDLPDVSVSRPSSRVSWGIPVPQDQTQSIYVWLDALVNYLTCAGYPDKKYQNSWPPNVQVLGKDILKFHGIYWPAFLIAAGLEPPDQLLVHSHWTVDGHKMSKSKGNVVDPRQRAVEYTSEGLRFFLLREGVAHSDGNYSDVKVQRTLNAELADTLGNLLSRTCAKSLNPKQIAPKFNSGQFNELAKLDITKKLMSSLDILSDTCSAHFQEYNFYLVVDSIMAVLHLANNFVETTKPWTLKNSEKIEDTEKLDTILRVTMEVLRISGIALQPIIPVLSSCLLDKLNVAKDQRLWTHMKWNEADMFVVKVLGNGDSVLFRRIIDSKPAETSKKKKKLRIRKNTGIH